MRLGFAANCSRNVAISVRKPRKPNLAAIPERQLPGTCHTSSTCDTSVEGPAPSRMGGPGGQPDDLRSLCCRVSCGMHVQIVGAWRSLATRVLWEPPGRKRSRRPDAEHERRSAEGADYPAVGPRRRPDLG